MYIYIYCIIRLANFQGVLYNNKEFRITGITTPSEGWDQRIGCEPELSHWWGTVEVLCIGRGIWACPISSSRVGPCSLRYIRSNMRKRHYVVITGEVPAHSLQWETTWDDRHFDATITSLRYVTVKLRLILLNDFEYVSVTKALYP